MLKEVVLPDWESFEKEVDSILSMLKKRRAEALVYVSKPIFRGMADASWGLETTLERFTNHKFSLEEYFTKVRGVRFSVESLSGREWRLNAKFKDVAIPTHPPQGYQFMIYLRHHGFPSPLLDWTLSPYIAAFFAFRRKNLAHQSVAIYCYAGELGYGRMGSQFTVGTIYPYVKTHPRHYIQQCQYTFALREDAAKYFYCKHEDAFEGIQAVVAQDMLVKFILPRSEREKVLAKLDFMNINAYSLFGNEEGLMEMLAYRELERE